MMGEPGTIPPIGGASIHAPELTLPALVKEHELGNVTLWSVNPIHDKELDEYVAIEADHPKLSTPQIANLLGKEINGIDILSLDWNLKGPKYITLPREVAVTIHIAKGFSNELIISHGLHDDSDDFSVIFPKDIKSELRKGIHK